MNLASGQRRGLSEARYRLQSKSEAVVNQKMFKMFLIMQIYSITGYQYSTGSPLCTVSIYLLEHVFSYYSNLALSDKF